MKSEWYGGRWQRRKDNIYKPQDHKQQISLLVFNNLLYACKANLMNIFVIFGIEMINTIKLCFSDYVVPPAPAPEE